MKNQKLLAVASVAALLSSSPAFAKTEGHHVGLDLLNTKSEFQYEYGNGFKDPKTNDNAFGVGLNYKYAFNINNFFIAPGAFFELNNSKAKGKLAGTDESFEVNNRLGLKVDLGYDITDNFAVYFTNGLASVSYDYRYEDPFVIAKKTGSESSYFYGLGLAYNINKNIGVSVEYNAQKMDFNSPFKGDKINAELSVAKLGVSYRF